jgi:hypothetical protein
VNDFAKSPDSRTISLFADAEWLTLTLGKTPHGNLNPTPKTRWTAAEISATLSWCHIFRREKTGHFLQL